VFDDIGSEEWPGREAPDGEEYTEGDKVTGGIGCCCSSRFFLFLFGPLFRPVFVVSPSSVDGEAFTLPLPRLVGVVGVESGVVFDVAGDMFNTC